MKEVISIKNLCLSSTDGDKKEILKDLNLSICEGEVVSISGPNGSGKSTLLKAIHGDMADCVVKKGEINVLGVDLLHSSSKEIELLRRKIAFVEQRDDFVGMNKATIEDWFQDSYIAYNGRAMDKTSFSKVLGSFFPKNEGYGIYANSIPAKLSGGQQRLVSIFLKLASRPDAPLIVIDEPLNNLDFEHARMVSNFLNSIHRDHPQSTILMVTHCLIITCIQKVFELKDGTIASPSRAYVANHCFGDPDSDGNYHF